ncbi:hypothetical protein K437DRAFT_276238 [Tilletiaria anomala UBC 951]|uniref:L domain-like protein n=1 Tax=Tilletiaria anomala (strain ATCC 24038 / CBS 436.72 / UBC 951) TaxID=1037660 RepID=A0A066VIZ7_TILAU|nr:uncharacterized protein K437DRAFT_276238 [Tilletiaria anomala UBC 951]KDN38565.1 hypothetical protein K437DRAFT_276238 [Tilletiaria anomala UBC 951]
MDEDFPAPRGDRNAQDGPIAEASTQLQVGDGNDVPSITSSSVNAAAMPSIVRRATLESHYRDGDPFIDSSSPSRNFSYNPRSSSITGQPPPGPSSGADYDMTPPSSPQSPLRTALSRNHPAAADPFSGNAKAPSMAHHPSFGKQFPHIKHPHPSRVLTPGSYHKATGSRRAIPNRGSSSPGQKIAGKKRTLDASPQQVSRSGADGSETLRSTVIAANSMAGEIFKSFFQDSDGANTSSDDSYDFGSLHRRAAGQAPDSRTIIDMDADEPECTASGLRGLGLGSAFEEQSEPSARIQGTSAASDQDYDQMSTAARQPNQWQERQKAFTRERSHPYDAFGCAPPTSHASTSVTCSPPQGSVAGGTLIGSPGSREPAVRRARLAGSSPTQLTVARRGRFVWHDSPVTPTSSDEEGMADGEDELKSFGRGDLRLRALVPGKQAPDAKSKLANLARPLRAWERLESQDLSCPKASQLISAAVAKAFDSSKPIIDLSNHGLQQLTPAIAELGDYVGILPLSRDSEGWSAGRMAGAASRHLSRTITTDSVNIVGETAGENTPNTLQAAAGNTLASPPRSVSHPVTQSLLRSSSTNSLSAHDPSASKLFLASNALRVLPSALFAVQNLSVLSLRKNALTELPAAIGVLRNLRELNIGDNQISYLPAEIQKLALQNFSYHPNPFFRPPVGAKLTLRHVRGFGPWSKSSKREAAFADTTMSPQQAEPARKAQLPMGPPPLPARILAARDVKEFGRTRSEVQVSHALSSNIPDLASYAGSSMLALSAASARSTAEASEAVTAPEGVAGQKRTRTGRASFLGHLTVFGLGVPTLRDICTRMMLELVDDEDHGAQDLAADAAGECARGRNGAAPKRRRKHLRLEELPNGKLRDMGKRGQLNELSLRQLESARRSATKSWNSRPELASTRIASPFAPIFAQGSKGSAHFPKRVFRSWCSGADVFNDAQNGSLSSSDVVAELNDNGDDAAQNPWFNRCPNPEHSADNVRPSAPMPVNTSLEISDWPIFEAVAEVGDVAPVFLQAGESLIEWVSHIAGIKVANASVKCQLNEDEHAVALDSPEVDGSGCLPVVWRGCKRNCLHFLHQ